MRLAPEQVLAATRAQLRQSGHAPYFSSLATDSRRIQKGSLFFALSGPHFDGHRFVANSLKKGAYGAVIRTRRRVKVGKGQWLFSVPDPERALGDIAAYWRQQFELPVIAITGSNGKTTTKEWLAQLLATRYRVLKNAGNFNNLIGLPLSLSALAKQHEVAILEMGMNAPGEIDRLAEIARPQVGIITNVARAHLEGLGSLEGVARAKWELMMRLPSDGVAVLNADDPWLMKLAVRCPVPQITFGLSRSAKVRGTILCSHPLRGSTLKVHLPRHKAFQVKIPYLGEHYARNALAAIAVANHFGISATTIKRSLSQVKPLWGRMEPLRLKNEILIINDAYNANPDSVSNALASFAPPRRRGGVKGRRRLVLLGDMLELGRFSKKAHQEVGRAAAQAGFAEIFAVGEYATDILAGAARAGAHKEQLHLCQNLENARQKISVELKARDLLFIKGSRGVKLETIITGLKKDLQS